MGPSELIQFLSFSFFKRLNLLLCSPGWPKTTEGQHFFHLSLSSSLDHIHVPPRLTLGHDLIYDLHLDPAFPSSSLGTGGWMSHDLSLTIFSFHNTSWCTPLLKFCALEDPRPFPRSLLTPSKHSQAWSITSHTILCCDTGP